VAPFSARSTLRGVAAALSSVKAARHVPIAFNKPTKASERKTKTMGHLSEHFMKGAENSKQPLIKNTKKHHVHCSMHPRKRKAAKQHQFIVFS
jgi:hypothetical protein